MAQHHTECISTINKLVRVLGETYLKTLKSCFLSAPDKRLSAEGFQEAAEAALLQAVQGKVKETAHYRNSIQNVSATGGETGDGAERAVLRRQQDIALREFNAKILGSLFSELDSDRDGKIDWLDMSALLVEGAAIKQTIKKFEDKPETKDWDHKEEVDKLVYIRQWRKVVICTQSKIVFVYSLNGSLYAEFRGHKSSVMTAVFLTAVNRLASSSSDSTVIVWDEKQRSILKQIPFPQPVLCMVSVRLETGAYLYVGGLDRAIKGYNLDLLMVWSPPDQSVANVEDRTVPAMHGTPGALGDDDSRRQPAQDAPRAWAGKKKLAGLTSHGAIGESDLHSHASSSTAAGSPKHRAKRAQARALSQSVSEGDSRVGSARGGAAAKAPPGARTLRSKIAAAPPAHKAAASAADGAAGHFSPFDARKYPAPLLRFGAGHDDWVTDLVVVSSLRLLVSASLDKTVRVWDLFTGELRYKKLGHTKGVLCLCYLEDYRLLLSSGYGKEVLVWNPFTPTPPLAYLTGHDKQVLGVVHYPNTPTCVTMDVTGRVIVWDIRTHLAVQSLGGPLSKYHPGAVTSFCLDVDGQQLFSIGKSMSWYRTLESAHAQKLKGAISRVLVSQTKQVVVVAAGSLVHKYSLFDGQLQQAHERLSQCDITALAWGSPDHGELAIGNAEGRVKILSTDQGTLLRAFRTSIVARIIDLYHMPDSFAAHVKKSGDHPPSAGYGRGPQQVLLVLSEKGQLVALDHTRSNFESPVLKHQAIIGGATQPNAAVVLSCCSTLGTLVLFGEHPDVPGTTVEAWNLKSLDTVLLSKAFDAKITAACMLEERNCLLTCNVAGQLWVWNQHNMALMIKVQLNAVPGSLQEEPMPFVATGVAFNEYELAIVITDEKHVKIMSFTSMASKFFDLHKDASWNLVVIPTDQQLYRRHYVIEKTIRGTSNEVRLGTDLRINKRVALKSVKDLHEYYAELELCKALGKAACEGVVRLFDHWPADKDGPSHLVFECGGRTLWDIINERRLDDGEVRAVVQGLMRGIEEIHRVGYIHNDVKPKNVVQFGSSWKIIDLDSSCKIGSPLPLAFTPWYCPPEMARKRKYGGTLEAAISYDLWSFGVLVLELVTSRRVFEGMLENELLDLLADERRLAVHMQRLTEQVGDPTLQVVIEATATPVAAERQSIAWCTQVLTEKRYLVHVNLAPTELRPFPPTVPTDVEILQVEEDACRQASDPASFKTTTVNATSITAAALVQRPHAVILGDYDSYAGVSLLRVYSLAMKYRGRLPVNDYDDSDVNWALPMLHDEPAPGAAERSAAAEGRLGRLAAKKATDGDSSDSDDKPAARSATTLRPLKAKKQADLDEEQPWLTRSPSALIKTFSWSAVKQKMDAVAASHAEEPPWSAAEVADLTPFFTEWQKVGVSYKPVAAFYAKNSRISQTPAALAARGLPGVYRRKGKKPKAGEEEAPHGRDVDFIRSLPRSLEKPAAAEPRPLAPAASRRERCACGRRLTGASLLSVDKSLAARLPQKPSAFVDSALWVAPPAKNAGGQNAGWAAEADSLLGMDTVVTCPKQHPLKESTTDAATTVCGGCQVPLPCCTPVYACNACEIFVCRPCYAGDGAQRAASERSPEPTPATQPATSRPTSPQDPLFEVYGGVRIPAAALRSAQQKQAVKSEMLATAAGRAGGMHPLHGPPTTAHSPPARGKVFII